VKHYAESGTNLQNLLTEISLGSCEHVQIMWLSLTSM